MDKNTIMGLLASLGGMTSVAMAQEHVCYSAIHNLPPGRSVYEVQLISWDKDVVEISIEAVEEKRSYTPWATNEAYACGMHPSGTLTPPENRPRLWKKEYNWCVDIGGNASFNPKVELAAELLTALRGMVGLSTEYGMDGKWTYCETTTYEIAYAPLLTQCWEHHARVLWIEAEITGKVTEIQGRFWWRDLVLLETVTTTCGERHSTGEAKDRRSDVVQRPPKTPDCPYYPGTPYSNPDPWDGLRHTPCCRPDLSCDEIQHPIQPCCGIIGGS